MRVLSFDIGGSKLSFALTNEDGCFVSESTSVPTPHNADEIAAFLSQTFAAFSPNGVAIASAGVVYQNHLIGKPNNLPAGYENINFSTLFSVPFVIENDANAAAWAEYKAGVLKNTENSLMLTLGTDVGCAIIAEGRLLHGKCGAAGEISMPVSGTSLKKMAQQVNLNSTDCFEIYANAVSGVTDAREVYRQWNENLVDGLNRLNRLLDTEIIALSGSLSKIVDYAQVNTMLKLLAPFNPPLVKPAKFSTDAGLVGAALLWLHQYRREQS